MKRLKKKRVKRERSQLAELLTKARLESGLTQMDVARGFNYTTSQFVSNWERGLSPLPIETLAKLIKIYGLKSTQIIEVLLIESEKQIRKIIKQA